MLFGRQEDRAAFWHSVDASYDQKNYADCIRLILNDPVFNCNVTPNMSLDSIDGDVDTFINDQITGHRYLANCYDALLDKTRAQKHFEIVSKLIERKYYCEMLLAQRRRTAKELQKNNVLAKGALLGGAVGIGPLILCAAQGNALQGVSMFLFITTLFTFLRMRRTANTGAK